MGIRLGEAFLFCEIILALAFSSLSFAKDKTSDFHVNIDEEQCLFEILRSPITKHRYPNLLAESFNDKNYFILKELDSFCSCSVNKRKSEITQKKIDKMSWRFRDKKEGLEKEDQCAISKFSDETLDLYYHVVVANRFKRELEEKLNKRLTKGMRILASDLSIQGQMICVESKILKRCTRIKSLRSTYQCIQETTSDPILMDELSVKCPNLIEKNNYRLAGDDLTI